MIYEAKLLEMVSLFVPYTGSKTKGLIKYRQP